MRQRAIEYFQVTDLNAILNRPLWTRKEAQKLNMADAFFGWIYEQEDRMLSGLAVQMTESTD